MMLSVVTWITVMINCQFVLSLDCGLHEHDLSGFRCCTKCGPGFGVIQTCNHDNDTKCAPCRLGWTFSEEYSHEQACQPCTMCPQYAHARRDCTHARDTACECHPQYFWDVGSGSCRYCDYCERGFGVRRSCGARENTECVKCAPGFNFSDEASQDSCKSCSVCAHDQIVVSLCDGMQDTVCLDISVLTTLTLLHTTPRVTTHTERDKHFELLPVYCSVLGLLILLLLIFVIYKQKQRCTNPDPHKNLNYTPVTMTPNSKSAATIAHGPSTSAHGPSASAHCPDAAAHATNIAIHSPSSTCIPPPGHVPTSDSGVVLESDGSPRMQAIQVLLSQGPGAGWERLAEHFNYSRVEISSLQHQSSLLHQLPSQLLLKNLFQSRNCSLDDLVRGLQAIGRPDAIRVLAVGAETQLGSTTHGPGTTSLGPTSSIGPTPSLATSISASRTSLMATPATLQPATTPTPCPPPAPTPAHSLICSCSSSDISSCRPDPTGVSVQTSRPTDTTVGQTVQPRSLSNDQSTTATPLQYTRRADGDPGHRPPYLRH